MEGSSCGALAEWQLIAEVLECCKSKCSAQTKCSRATMPANGPMPECRTPLCGPNEGAAVTSMEHLTGSQLEGDKELQPYCRLAVTTTSTPASASSLRTAQNTADRGVLVQSTDRFQCKSQQKYLLLEKKSQSGTKSDLEERGESQSAKKRDNSFGQHTMASIK